MNADFCRYEARFSRPVGIISLIPPGILGSRVSKNIARSAMPNLSENKVMITMRADSFVVPWAVRCLSDLLRASFRQISRSVFEDERVRDFVSALYHQRPCTAGTMELQTVFLSG